MSRSIFKISGFCALFCILFSAQESQGAKMKKKPPPLNGHGSDGGDGSAMNAEDFGKALVKCIESGEVTMGPERVEFLGEMQKTEEAKEKFAQCLMKHININVNPLTDPKFCNCFSKTMDCACK